ncbi:response regulator [Tardiphaga robiniae]|uniref:LuxR family transcriptional regulator n=1 Tax=Tardiphaga robiniae TaxID=943830 RepID=A0A164AGT9_9BRAD|nr:response regulator [Tardiphaga robiniae]KZD24787.1 LuxR family transcriptional regulator [Tardiphaga robiniae]
MKRILVVDDDPLVSMSIRLTLEREGFETVSADGGEIGLLALEDTRFDVMIVDIFMPQMRGFESVRAFHQRRPRVPLIAISGYTFAQFTAPAPDFLRMVIELGATSCLRKPFSAAALIAAVRECLADTQAPQTLMTDD